MSTRRQTSFGAKPSTPLAMPSPPLPTQEVEEKVKTFVRRAQKEFGLPIKKVRSDNGTEFKNTLVE